MLAWSARWTPGAQTWRPPFRAQRVRCLAKEPRQLGRLALDPAGALRSASQDIALDAGRTPDAKASCDPMRFLASPPYFDWPHQTEKLDLSGVGKKAVVVTYSTAATAIGTTILAPTGGASCFRQVYADEQTYGVRRLSTRTHGWNDLALSVGFLSRHGGRGAASIVATYDGTQYRWSRVLTCGMLLPASECREEMAARGPNRRPVVEADSGL
jgi:hypothetical protein